MSLNKHMIIGTLGNDPELRYTQNNHAVCRLSVATTEKYKEKETTTWHTVNCWGKTAEACAKYLSKGKKVYVEGPIRANKFTDKKGIERTTMEVTAEKVEFLSPRQVGEAESQSKSSHQSQEAEDGFDFNSDIPF
jgi:single-strand DNA-binding protein